MADSTQLPTAQQARDNAMLAVVSRLKERHDANVHNDLVDPPGVAAIIPADPDGLLDARQIQQSFVVTIPQWGTNPTPEPERVRLRWARKETPDTKILLVEQVVPPGTNFPLSITVASKDYLQGQLELSYDGVNMLGNAFMSAVLPITLDTVPPYGDGSPEELTADTDVITDAYLTGAGGEVTLTVPITYPEHAATDTVYFCWLKEIPSNPDDRPPPSVPLFQLGTSTEIKMDRTLLASVGDGQCYGVYFLQDKAGNISRLSYWYTATVALGALPENLQAPRVPYAEDGKVDRYDAHLGVKVEIPPFDNAKFGDLLHVKWGDATLPVVPIGANPESPITVAVPWEALEAGYDYEAEDPLQKVTVGYHVTRVGLPFPAAPLTTEVNVQFRVVGPEKPDPDPVNPALPVLVAKGESDLDNKLVDTDNGKDATATFKLFANAKEDDEITLHWGGLVNLNIYYVGAQDVPGETDVSIIVPWSLIEEASNSLELPVFYRISDAEQVNYQQSPTTLVNVQAVMIELPAPEFPDIWESETGFKVLNCESVIKQGEVHGFRVHVPPNAHIKAGMTVTFDWIVAENADGTGSIAGTELVEPIVVSPEQERNGIDWFVGPYAEKILPAFTETASTLGYTRLKYSTLIGEIPTESTFVHEMIGLDIGGGNSCKLA